MNAIAKRENRTPDEVEAQWRAMVPAGRFAETREIGAAVAFLASQAASYISGISLMVGGGRTNCL